MHGFDLTFCAPKSVSLIRALKADDVADKAILDAHTTAISEVMEYLAVNAGYTRVHNAVTGEKDLVAPVLPLQTELLDIPLSDAEAVVRAAVRAIEHCSAWATHGTLDWAAFIEKYLLDVYTSTRSHVAR